ncbi:MAG: indole-3-glycerol phosphate synthase TrpC [Pyrinomonadaceae bacterium]
MKGTFLDKIIEAKRIRIDKAKADSDLVLLAEQAARSDAGRFRNALSNRSRVNIIAEFKRASPSKGIINDQIDPEITVQKYQNGGAAAISVLTEEDFFRGSSDDLAAIRNAVALPILRKDFIVDEFQIYESAAFEADAILLIVAALSVDELLRFHTLSSTLGLDALVEVHDLDELKIASDIGATLIGVNNRNLKTFEVTLDVSRELIASAPKDAIMVSESGIRTKEDVDELSSLGYSGFLIGETLMKSDDVMSEMRKLIALS